MTFDEIAEAARKAGNDGAWHEEDGGFWMSETDGLNSEVRSVLESAAKLVCDRCATGCKHTLDNDVVWHNWADEGTTGLSNSGREECDAAEIWRVLEANNERG